MGANSRRTGEGVLLGWIRTMMVQCGHVTCCTRHPSVCEPLGDSSGPGAFPSPSHDHLGCNPLILRCLVGCGRRSCEGRAGHRTGDSDKTVHYITNLASKVSIVQSLLGSRPAHASEASGQTLFQSLETSQPITARRSHFQHGGLNPRSID
jgi:hypothetical protein